MTNLEGQVEKSIRTRRLFLEGESILVAVSGGLDSMALLRLLQGLSKKHRWRLTVAHLNHQLRGRSSDADERLVRNTACKLRLPAVVEAVDVRTFAHDQKLSLEMAARKLRHEFLARAAAQLKIPTIALAHHADDQIELFFLRLFRGSGGEGLAGMRWRNPSPSDPKIELVRPLLQHPKAALRQYAADKKIPFREDASNALLDIQRNRIRHQLIPLLREQYQPALDSIILRVMDIVGVEADFVTHAASEWLRQKRPIAFEKLSIAVQRRCLQLQLLGRGIAPDYQLVEQLRLMPNRPLNLSRSRLANLRNPLDLISFHVLRDVAGRVHLQPLELPHFRSGSFELELTKPAGELLFDGANINWKILSSKALKRPRRAAGNEIFDADLVGSPVFLRHWQPGDRFQPIGLDSPTKLQDFFINEKIPRWRRHELILALTASGEIFWVENLRISERFKLTKQSTRRLHWRWQRLVIS